MTYLIVRISENDRPSRTIRRGLSLAEAQAHCRSPETRSKTATGAAARRHTNRHGDWFDGYDTDK